MLLSRFCCNLFNCSPVPSPVSLYSAVSLISFSDRPSRKAVARRALAPAPRPSAEGKFSHKRRILKIFASALPESVPIGSVPARCREISPINLIKRLGVVSREGCGAQANLFVRAESGPLVAIKGSGRRRAQSRRRDTNSLRKKCRLRVSPADTLYRRFL